VSITRYRCTACGNLTRFDVVHDPDDESLQPLHGGRAISRWKKEEVLAESVDEVCCRWCGHGEESRCWRTARKLPTAAAPTQARPDAAGNLPSDPRSIERRAPTAVALGAGVCSYVPGPAGRDRRRSARGWARRFSLSHEVLGTGRWTLLFFSRAVARGASRSGMRYTGAMPGAWRPTKTSSLSPEA